MYKMSSMKLNNQKRTMINNITRLPHCSPWNILIREGKKTQSTSGRFYKSEWVPLTRTGEETQLGQFC